MTRLTLERYLSARRFIYDRGRELERLLFEHEFEGAPAWPVFDALGAYQNPDGGYGRGLEPDFVTPASSALATSVALRHLADVGAPGHHPQVVAAVAYLTASLDPQTHAWRIVPDAGGAPHAPWWTPSGLEERFAGYRLNPRADILAQLVRLDAGRELVEELLSEVVAEVERQAANGLEMHDAMCAARLLDALPADRAEHARLLEALGPAVSTAVAAAAAGGYGLRALDVAPKPGSALAPALADAARGELAALIREQAEDGAWWPVWNWGDDLPPESASAWEASRLAWAGAITLNNLRSLAAFGLLDRG